MCITYGLESLGARSPQPQIVSSANREITQDLYAMLTESEESLDLRQRY